MNKIIAKVPFIFTLLLGVLSWIIIVGGATITYHLLYR